MRKKTLIIAILLSLSLVSYSDDKDEKINNNFRNYDIQLNLGYDLFREISKAPKEKENQKGSMNQGYTLGLEYLFKSENIEKKNLYGLGFQYRSKLKNKDAELHRATPLFMSIRRDFYHDRFYYVGRLGYNLITDSDVDGGHYIGLGIGKKLGYIHVDAMWENMGYKFKSSSYGIENRVGIKFGFRLGEMYDSIRNPKKKVEEKSPPTPILPSVKEGKIIVKRVVEVREVYIIKESGLKYEVNRYELTSETKNYLDRLKEQDLKEGTYNKVIITGNTDKSGSKEYNQILSERRAKAVADYLDLPKDKVEVKGVGESNPLGGAPEEDRRVEIEVRR